MEHMYITLFSSHCQKVVPPVPLAKVSLLVPLLILTDTVAVDIFDPLLPAFALAF